MREKMQLDVERCFDVTRTLSADMTVYPGDPLVQFEPHLTIAKDRVNLTRIVLGSHSGTHVDAPRHFLPGGKSVEQVSPSKFIGEAVVIDESNGSGNINAAKLARYSNVVERGDILLIYSGISRDPTNFAYLDVSAAEWIIEHKIKCVGTNTLSVEKYGSKDAPVHRLLLSNEVGIIENLHDSIRDFANKKMFLVCLPLPLRGVDGSPARVVLFEMIK